MERKTLAQLAQETLQILHDGRYTAPSGATVDIAEALVQAKADTIQRMPGEPLPSLETSARAQMTVEVRHESVLSGAQQAGTHRGDFYPAKAE